MGLLTKKVMLTSRKYEVLVDEVKKRSPHKLIFAALHSLSFFGLHRFYLGHFWVGIFFAATGGFLGLGSLIDFLNMRHNYAKEITRIEEEVLEELLEIDFV